MEREKWAVSACLCGQCVRYDGKSNTVDALKELVACGKAVPLCPECLGGLTVPRVPCERRGDRVMNRDGEDRTVAFSTGAEAVLAYCQSHGITRAILKENSPSCGSHAVYDGTFSGKKIPGAGVTAELLRANGIKVFSEQDFLSGLVDKIG